MNDRTWSVDFRPIYDDPEEWSDGYIVFSQPSTLRAVRVAIKVGDTEALTFHAVRPVPTHLGADENFVYTWRAIPAGKMMDFNPLKQLIADAEVGRKIREAGLELKS